MAKKGKRKGKKKKGYKRKGSFSTRIPAHTVCRDRKGRFTRKTSCRV